MSEDELYVRARVPKIRIQRRGNQFHVRGHNPPRYSFYEQGSNLASIFNRVAERLSSEFPKESNDKPRA